MTFRLMRTSEIESENWTEVEKNWFVKIAGAFVEDRNFCAYDPTRNAFFGRSRAIRDFQYFELLFAEQVVVIQTLPLYTTSKPVNKPGTGLPPLYDVVAEIQKVTLPENFPSGNTFELIESGFFAYGHNLNPSRTNSVTVLGLQDFFDIPEPKK